MVWIYLVIYLCMIFFLLEVSLLREKSGAEFIRESIAIILWPLVLAFAVVALVVVLISTFIYREEKEVDDE